MKARIPRMMNGKAPKVKDIKDKAAKQLEGEFNARYQQAILEGAKQGIAFVMYTLELNQGWKTKRQQKLFEDMMSVMALGESWIRPFEASDMKKHIEESFDIDFKPLFEKIAARPPAP